MKFQKIFYVYQKHDWRVIKENVTRPTRRSRETSLQGVSMGNHTGHKDVTLSIFSEKIKR